MKGFCKKNYAEFLVVAVYLSYSIIPALAADLPQGFCYLDKIVPTAVYDARYYGNNNFVGKRVGGYRIPRIILTAKAAQALSRVQDDLVPFGLGLKIFDGYRPQQAVNHFMRWAKDLKDTAMKEQFYPDVLKENLFRDGYIASRSGHSRGSTVDLTIIDLETGRELDMGTPFDYFDPRSWPERIDFPVHVRANRSLLRHVMAVHGFKPLQEEWWHFTLRDEPYPDTYFDFPVQ